MTKFEIKSERTSYEMGITVGNEIIGSLDFWSKFVYFYLELLFL